MGGFGRCYVRGRFTFPFSSPRSVFRASRPGVPVCLFPLCLRLHGCPRSQTIRLSVYWKKFSYNTDVIA
ncbi:hypothetical protein HMPREF1631_04925 [Arcanobacterium sp. S3PF19]|nr:hypothetical protein HMPREF1631_04925 [Arcanobacterium sp. S3PF19]